MIYLVKARPDIFWWYIREKKFQFLYTPPISVLVARLQEYDFFSEEETIVVAVPAKVSELSSLTNIPATPGVVGYILLSDVEGVLDKTAEKIYKSVAGGHIRQLDLSHWKWWSEGGIAERLSKYPPETQERFITDLPSPRRLAWQLTQPNPLDYTTASDLDYDAVELVKCLGEYESLAKWGDIPRDKFYRLFTPDLNQSAMYQILAGGGKRFGLCTGLWIYLNMTLEGLLEVYRAYPQAVTKLFAAWVLLATKLWADNRHKGFTQSVSRGKTFYNFLPSTVAYEALQDIITNPVISLNYLLEEEHD
jgi:hypothetical protein